VIGPTKEASPDSAAAPQGASTQGAFFEAAEVQLKEWSATVERLAAEAEKLPAEGKAKTQKAIGELKAKLGAARGRVNATKSLAGEKWLEAKGGVESLWAEVKAVFEKHDPKPPA
jgi:hypothetical protein